MLFIFLFPYVGLASGLELSECIPPAKELGVITLRNSPYFSNKLFTPLQLSIMYNDTDTAYGFLWEMASSTVGVSMINETDQRGMTLLHWAAFVGNIDIVQSLLCFGADVDAVDIEGNTPLHFSALNTSPYTIRNLVTLSKNINAKNCYGSTPLHLATKNGVFSVILTLLANGARTDIEDKKGRVALKIAIAGGNIVPIKLLKAFGANENIESNTELYQWTGKDLGKNPVVGGNGGYCSKEEFVGRVHYEGNIIPAKICPLVSKAYAAYNGTELALDEYEILDSEHIAWKPMDENKEIPSDAFVGGRTKDGEKLYIGRAKILTDGAPNLASGKVVPSDKCLHTTFNNQEYIIKKYEILILQH